MFQLIAVIFSMLADGRAAVAQTVDACTLLASADIQAVLGEPVKERKPGTETAGKLLTSHCFFGTSSAKSVSLTLTSTNAASRSGLTPREYWHRQFHPADHDEDHDGRARPIPGVGVEAYWTGNRFAGALYVLRGDAFLRISVGGIRDEQTRIANSKTLALAVLKHLGGREG